MHTNTTSIFRLPAALAAVLAFFVLALVGCGGGSDESSNPDETTATEKRNAELDAKLTFEDEVGTELADDAGMVVDEDNSYLFEYLRLSEPVTVALIALDNSPVKDDCSQNVWYREIDGPQYVIVSDPIVQRTPDNSDYEWTMDQSAVVKRLHELCPSS